MWVCWGSERGSSGPGRRLAAWAALIGLALVAGTAPAWAAPRDSSRVVRSVTIDDQGVRIVRSDGSVTTRSSSDSSDEGRVDIDVPGLKINASGRDIGSSGRVRIHGPVIVVDGDDHSSRVRVFQDVEVATGEHVAGDVVAVFGSATVDGQVDGDVVAVFGSVHLGEHASVRGDAVAVGGTLDQTGGSSIGGESVSLDFFPLPFVHMPALPMLVLTVFLGWLVTIVMAWLMTALFPDRMRRVALTASRRTAASFFLGMLSAPLFVVLLCLLFITVIGIPVAILLPLVYLLAVWAGQIAAAWVLGTKLLRRPIGEGSPMAAIAAGTLLVALLFVAASVLSIPQGVTRTMALFLTLLGLLMLVALSTVGTGALMLSRGGESTEGEAGGGNWGTAPASPPPVSPPPAGPPPAAPVSPPLAGS